VVLGRTEGGTIDEAEITRRIVSRPRVQRSLAEVSLPTAGALLNTYAGRAQDLTPWLADAQINRQRSLRLQYLAGLAAHTDQRFSIFREMVAHRRYPADLFVASADTEMQLRAWYEQ
jgi:hypothetical protein